MAKVKVKPVKNLSELRYKLAELMAAVENHEMEVNEANSIFKGANIIVNACKVEAVHNYTNGITKSIDFIEDSPNKLKKAE